jgi:hypothetical protein
MTADMQASWCCFIVLSIGQLGMPDKVMKHYIFNSTPRIFYAGDMPKTLQKDMKNHPKVVDSFFADSAAELLDDPDNVSE